MYAKWNLRWQTQPDCRQTFQFFPCVDRSKSKEIIKMSRKDISILIRYLTGHAHLRRHDKICDTMQPRALINPQPLYTLVDPDENHIGNYDEDIICRICKLKGSEETPYHIYKQCLGAWRKRRELTGSYTFENEDPIKWEPSNILEFFKHFDLENKPN